MHVNTHIHTPYSFSSFDSVEQAVLLAKEEDVGVLGINDFDTVEGHSLFSEICNQHGIYPIFNIEFATLIEEDRIRALRWNDITYPGVMYLCGKALNFPTSFDCDSKNLLASIWKVSQDRIWKIISNINDYLQSLSLDIVLDYQQIRNLYAKQAVRERHLSKALYMQLVKKWNDPNILLQKIRLLFKDESFTADLSDAVTMQNEIRNHLFKPGKIAYVNEDYSSFARFFNVKYLILQTGGIPCYPLSLDISQGLTEKENNIGFFINALLELGIYAVEFISNRVSFDLLKTYVHAFHEKGFCISFGTEHCTPERYSLIPGTLGGRPFDPELEQIAYEGACIYAAHQELHKQNRSGFVDETGKKLINQNKIKDFIRIGDEAIKKVVFCQEIQRI